MYRWKWNFKSITITVIIISSFSFFYLSSYTRSVDVVMFCRAYAGCEIRHYPAAVAVPYGKTSCRHCLCTWSFRFSRDYLRIRTVYTYRSARAPPQFSRTLRRWTSRYSTTADPSLFFIITSGDGGCRIKAFYVPGLGYVLCSWAWVEDGWRVRTVFEIQDAFFFFQRNRFTLNSSKSTTFKSING